MSVSARITGAGRNSKIAAVVALTLVVQATISLLAACVPVLAPSIAVDRGWGVGLIALYTPIVYGVAFLANFWVPPLLARFGGMGVSIGAILISAVGLVCLLSADAFAVALAPVAIGCAAGAMNPASSQILGPRTTPANAGLVMSIKQTGVPLGAMLAGLLVPVFVLRSNWQQAVFELAVASVIVAAALLSVRRWLDGPRAAAAKVHRPFGPAKSLLTIPGMPRFMLAAMTCAAMLLCLRTFFVVYLVDRLGFDLVTAGLAFGISQAAGIIGQVVWATASDRRPGAHAILALLCIMMAAAAILTAFLAPHWPRAALFGIAALFGVSAAGHLPVILGEITRRAPPGQAGVLTSGANVFLIGGTLIGPLVFGAVGAVFDYPAAFLALGLCSLAGAFMLRRALFQLLPVPVGNSATAPLDREGADL